MKRTKGETDASLSSTAPGTAICWISTCDETRSAGGAAKLAYASNVQQHNQCQRHLVQAKRHGMCLQRKPRERCHPYQPHCEWHNVRCKQSGSRRPNCVHLAGLPHCQHAGVDCAWVLHCRNRAREAEVQASLPPATPCYCLCTMPR